MSKTRLSTRNSGSNARVVVSGKDGAFRAYKVPEKSLRAKILDGTNSFLVRVLRAPEAPSIQVGNNVASVKKRFDFKK